MNNEFFYNFFTNFQPSNQRHTEKFIFTSNLVDCCMLLVEEIIFLPLRTDPHFDLRIGST